jgi:PKD repeat protein
MTIPDECYHEIRYYSVDNSGLIEDMKFEIDLVDHTPPTITKKHPDPCYFPINQTAGIIKVGDRIVLEAVDGGTPPCISGVEGIFWGFELDGIWHPIDITDTYDGNSVGYYKDGKWWYTYTKPIEFQEECKHILEYWTKDNVCNTGPTHRQIYWVNDCQDEVWIDDDFGFYTPGWWHDHFATKQRALDWLGPGGTAYVFPGLYMGDIFIDDVPCCDNTGITQMGEYGCFPVGPSAVIRGSETIKVNDVTIKYLEYTPNVDGAIIVDQGISGTTIRCNKFVKDCVQHAIGVLSYTDEPVNAELNWWGVPDGPSGGKMDDGKTANGFGVKVIGNNVDVEPWIGIHAEIAEPSSTIEVEVGTSVQFDAEGSWAYTYGECCQEPELLPMQYLWDFGDGYYSANKVASHTFDNPGSYKVSIRVDSPGIPGLYPNFMYDWDYVIVHVVTPDTPLTANADGGNLGGYETIVGEPIYFHGDAYGGDGNYVFSWDFGDNKGTSNEQNPTYVYDKEGKYTATLTVYSDGETATDTADVTVLGIDELIVDLTDTSTVTGTETWFTASVSGGKKPYSYLWEFGDGETSTDANPSHVYDSVGKYTVSLTVTDSNDKVRSDVATVDVAEGKTIEPVEIKDVQCSIGSVKAIINTGSYPVDWSIDVEGGFVMLGGYSSGSLPEKSEMTVETPFTFGFGNVEITVTANELTEKHSAFLLGPFFL